MKVTRNVKPRDLADWLACRYLALSFWSRATLFTFGPVLLLAVLSVAWMQPLTSLVPSVQLTMSQIGLTAAVLTPLYFARHHPFDHRGSAARSPVSPRTGVGDQGGPRPQVCEVGADDVDRRITLSSGVFTPA
jgi:hypothetical protein